MKTQLIEKYWSNGRLMCRYHKTNTGKFHGFAESYDSDGSIDYIGYYDMSKLVKLENDYWSGVIKIRYFI